MGVYAVVSISGDHTIEKQEVKTHVDRSGGSNPTWNFPIQFTFNESLAQQNRLTLNFKIKSDGLLGEVIVPIKELLDSSSSSSSSSSSRERERDAKSMKLITQVRSSSGNPKGELHFSYKFSELKTHLTLSSAASGRVRLPAATASRSGVYDVYPPPPPGYEYLPPPPQHGHGYPLPQQPGSRYPPVKPLKKSNGGLEAGLLGGMLGGLLIGDIVSDVADYDGGDFGGDFDL
ncbi:C2 domain-containing protein [Citrus sinensis]|nr:C2 domain-containing protein [Citrus sinensis]